MTPWLTMYATATAGCGARSMDRVAVREGPGWVALALADGAGGMGGGEAAAEAVMACLAEADVPGWVASQGLDAAATLDALDRRLARGAEGGQTTAVLLAIAEGRLVGASVGDSEAWVRDRAGWVALTSGQARKPLVGDGAAAAVPFGAAYAGGRVLVASDGLFKYARRSAIWEVAATGSLRAAASALVTLVRLPGGSLRDDVSLALLGANPAGAAPIR